MKFTLRLFKCQLYFDTEIKYGKLPFEAKPNAVNAVIGKDTKLHLSTPYFFVMHLKIIPT